MTNRLMMSVAAAALITGTGFVYAQGTGGGMSQGGAVSQSAPSSSPMNHETGGASGTKGSESDEMKGAPAEKMEGGKNQRAQDGSMGQKSKSTSSEMNEGARGGTKDGTKGGAKDLKAERPDSKTNSAQSREGMNSKEGMPKEGMSKESTSAQSRSGSNESRTTGNAATSATAAPPAEKRSEIASAIKSEKVEEVTHVNFNIAVGTAIPAEVRFHPLPARIVEIYPEWRGYDFILVNGRYIIVRPQTREIVYIIEG
jgi:hypothetical protein